MAFDIHKNLAISSVATAPTPATSGTSLTVKAGEGARFGAPPFNATAWPANAVPTPANAEVIRVTAVAGDVLTIARGQEGSTPRAIGTNDLLAATITAKTLTDLETQAALKDAANVFTQSQTISAPTYPSLALVDQSMPANTRRWQYTQTLGNSYIQPANDAGGALLNALGINRNGSIYPAGGIVERGRVTAMGEWVNEPFNAAHYTASAPLILTVTPATFAHNRYTLFGKTMVWSVAINAAALTGAPGVYLVVYLPGGQVLGVGSNSFSGVGTTNLGTWQALILETTPGTPFIKVYRQDASNFPTGAVYVHFTMTVEVM